MVVIADACARGTWSVATFVSVEWLEEARIENRVRAKQLSSPPLATRVSESVSTISIIVLTLFWCAAILEFQYKFLGLVWPCCQLDKHGLSKRLPLRMGDGCSPRYERSQEEIWPFVLAQYICRQELRMTKWD